jgi:hypothetical protein
MPMVAMVIHTMLPRFRRQNWHHGQRSFKELGVTRQTLYRFVGPKGELRADGTKLLKRKARTVSS